MRIVVSPFEGRCSGSGKRANVDLHVMLHLCTEPTKTKLHCQFVAVGVRRPTYSEARLRGACLQIDDGDEHGLPEEVDAVAKPQDQLLGAAKISRVAHFAVCEVRRGSSDGDLVTKLQQQQSVFSWQGKYGTKHRGLLLDVRTLPEPEKSPWFRCSKVG